MRRYPKTFAATLRQIHRESCESLYPQEWPTVEREHRLRVWRSEPHVWHGKCACGQPDQIGGPYSRRQIIEWHWRHQESICREAFYARLWRLPLAERDAAWRAWLTEHDVQVTPAEAGSPPRPDR